MTNHNAGMSIGVSSKPQNSQNGKGHSQISSETSEIILISLKNHFFSFFSRFFALFAGNKDIPGHTGRCACGGYRYIDYFKHGWDLVKFFFTRRGNKTQQGERSQEDKSPRTQVQRVVGLRAGACDFGEHRNTA